jgi:hypothetical protein
MIRASNFAPVCNYRVNNNNSKNSYEHFKSQNLDYKGDECNWCFKPKTKVCYRISSEECAKGVGNWVGGADPKGSPISPTPDSPSGTPTTPTPPIPKGNNRFLAWIYWKLHNGKSKFNCNLGICLSRNRYNNCSRPE